MRAGIVQLIKAAMDGDVRAVRELVAVGLDVNGRDPCLGNSALGEAASHGFIDVITFLLEAGADVDGPGYSNATPLMLAAYHGQLDAAQFLLSAGADVNHAKRRTGETALHWAALKGRTALARILVYAGADVNARTRASVGQDDFPWVEVCGETPLHYAAAYADEALVDFLLEHGADRGIRTAGETALQWAKLMKRPRMLRQALEEDASEVGAGRR